MTFDSRCIACWFSLIMSGWSSKVRVIVQSSRSQDETSSALHHFSPIILPVLVYVVRKKSIRSLTLPSIKHLRFYAPYLQIISYGKLFWWRLTFRNVRSLSLRVHIDRLSFVAFFVSSTIFDGFSQNLRKKQLMKFARPSLSVKENGICHCLWVMF